jgi:hypothetical protein
MSLIINPKNEDEYLAIISRKEILAETTFDHNIFLVHLNLAFDIIKYVSLKTTEPVIDQIQIGTEHGIEHCVILNDTMFLALVHGRTEQKVPMVCLCHFKDDIVHTITPFDTAGSLNPIILKFNLTNIFAIHSYSPFRIMSFNMDTGANQLIHMAKVFNEEQFIVARGSSCYLDDFKEYLLVLRVERDNKYLCSYWVTLTERFKLCGISEQFLFNVNYKRSKRKSGETCTSLLVRNKTLYASINVDNEIFIYEYSVENIHKTIVKV